MKKILVYYITAFLLLILFVFGVFVSAENTKQQQQQQQMEEINNQIAKPHRHDPLEAAGESLSDLKKTKTLKNILFDGLEEVSKKSNEVETRIATQTPGEVPA